MVSVPVYSRHKPKDRCTQTRKYTAVIFDQPSRLNQNMVVDVEVGKLARWSLLASLMYSNIEHECVLHWLRKAVNRCKCGTAGFFFLYIINQLGAYCHLLYWTAYYICREPGHTTSLLAQKLTNGVGEAVLPRHGTLQLSLV